MKIPIYYSEKCKSYDPISGCKVHDDNNLNLIKCTTCMPGYVLETNGLTCTLITTPENCVQKATPTGDC